MRFDQGALSKRSRSFSKRVFRRDDVQCAQRDAAAVIGPAHHATSARMNSSVIGARDVVAMAAARDDRKWLERPGLETITYLSNHRAEINRVHNSRLLTSAPTRASYYFIECSPIIFPSVSCTSEMKPYSPMGNFSLKILPPFCAARFASTEQSIQLK